MLFRQRVEGRMRKSGIVAIGCLCAALAGCKKKAPEEQAGVAGQPAQPAVAEPALRPIGMDDPFARLSGDGPRQLNLGYRALRTKKYDDARAAFGEVITLTPDHGPARYQQVRAIALSGKLADVPDAWAGLLARDYVAFAGKLEKPKEMAPLRAAPEWAAVQRAEKDYRYAYSKGLERGLFFVARTREAGAVRFAAGGTAPLDLNQEAYHFDPAASKYRRLTETGGHLFAIAVSPGHKVLSFLVARKLASAGDGQAFDEPEVGYVDLVSLETVGPFKIAGRPAQVALGFTAAGEPVWEAGEKYMVDSAKTAVAAQAAAQVAGAKTVATPQVVHGEPAAASGARVSADGRAIEIAGADKPVRAARDLDPSSIEWSPGKKRLTYAGKIDACKVIAGETKEAKNELFVWEADKKTASRVAQAVSYFDTLWLDDDKLVYEGGVGKDGKLHVVDLATRNDVALKPRYGAGLYGFPTLSCEKPSEGAPDTEVPPEEGAPEGE
jgi:hypothetical protein